MGVCDCGYQVGSARAAGGDANAKLAASRCVTLGSVTSTLLVANQNVTNFLGVHQWVVGRQDCATRQTKDVLNTKQLKRTNNRLGSG